MKKKPKTQSPKRQFFAKLAASKSVGRYSQDAVTIHFFERVPTCATKTIERRVPYLLTAIGSNEAIAKRGRQIIRDLKNGWSPTKKSEVFRDTSNQRKPWNRRIK